MKVLFEAEGQQFYHCDPNKNKECKRTHCYINGGDCMATTQEEFAMENEIRYYLKSIKALMAEPEEGEEREPFKPQYFITATMLPTGAIELAVNTSNIAEKIDYILEAYDEDMCLKTNRDIHICQLMIV